MNLLAHLRCWCYNVCWQTLNGKRPYTEWETQYLHKVGHLPCTTGQRKQAYLDWVLTQPCEPAVELPFDKAFREFVAELAEANK